MADVGSEQPVVLLAQITWWTHRGPHNLIQPISGSGQVDEKTFSPLVGSANLSALRRGLSFLVCTPPCRDLGWKV